MVRTTYDPISEINPLFTSLYSEDVTYCYGAEVEGKYPVIAIVHDQPGNTWIIDAEQDVIDLLSTSLPYIGDPHPLFYIAVVAYGKYAQAVAPNPTGNTYFGRRVVSRRPANRTWEEFRNIEYQITNPEPKSLLAFNDVIKNKKQ